MVLATTNTMSTPWWFWLIIGVLTIIGILLGAWGFMSGFKKAPKITKRNYFNEVFDLPKVNWSQIDHLPEQFGVYIMYIGQKYNNEDFFIPIYIGKTANIRLDVSKLKQMIFDNEPNTIGSEVTSYLLQKELVANDINFYFVKAEEPVATELFNNFVEKTSSNKRGFKK